MEKFSLNTIRDNKGARSKSKVAGRGIGSGKGKTAGHGVKGQKARSGVSLNGFEGGQNPIYRRLPKRGFVNIHADSYYELDFIKLNRLLKAKKVKESDTVDREFLISVGLMSKSIKCVSLIANGEPEGKFTLQVTRASKKAQEIAKAKGSVVTIG